MIDYPTHHNTIYVNDGGNLAASGDHRSYVNQRMSNMFPPWMHIRESETSLGQQFLSPLSMTFGKVENQMDEFFKCKYLSTAPLDEIDTLYKVKLPSNVDLTDASASGVRCVAAPSGHHPSGVNQIWVKEITDLEEFYYQVLPTRVEIASSGDYLQSIDGIEWHSSPSGILDRQEKKIDIWKTEHDITWCCTDSSFRKQDRVTMEDYEVYPVNGYGIPVDMDYYNGILYWIGIDESNYYLNLTNTRTQVPRKTRLDLLAAFNLTDGFELQPNGVIVDSEGTVWINDLNKTRVYEVIPRYDVFILDANNRYLYFREKYNFPGVFISNTGIVGQAEADLITYTSSFDSYEDWEEFV